MSKKPNKLKGRQTEWNRPLSEKEQEFAELQSKWYAKLAENGFEDQEWVDHKTGFGHDAPFRKKTSCQIRKKYDPAVEEHFRRCRVFLEHGQIKPLSIKRLFEWYTEGLSTRQIATKIKEQRATWRGKRTFERDFSHNWVAERLREVLDYMEFWHYLSENGLDNPANDEYYIEDIPIRPMKEEHE